MSAPLSFEEARERLLARATPIDDIESVSLFEADGRIVAQPLISTLDVPAWDNSQMDGYAVRAAEIQPGKPMPVSQRIPAGHPGQPLQPGTVARIFTGAAMPAGADAVVMQEEAQVNEDGTVAFQVAPKAGAWVRRQAEDIARGSTVLPVGLRLTPASIGLAASVGAATLQLRRRPRVACFFTGDELTMPGEPLPPGGIYNSNRFVLNALLRRLGCEVDDLGIIRDNLDATREALRRAARHADLIITVGGVSVGEEDHVRPAVAAEGEIDLWRMAIKPGKPLAYGRVRRGDAQGGFAHFIGLPGNPVSSYVTFLMLVRPFILKLQGAQAVQPRAVQMQAGFDWLRPDPKRREFLRAVVMADERHVDLYHHQGSAVLTSAALGHGLIDNPPGQVIRQGDIVRFLPFGELLD